MSVLDFASLLLIFLGRTNVKKKRGCFTIIMIAIGLLGVLLPIAWDYYVGRNGVTVTVVSRSIVISPSAEVDGLRTSYKGTELSTLSQRINLGQALIGHRLTRRLANFLHML